MISTVRCRLVKFADIFYFQDYNIYSFTKKSLVKTRLLK